LKTDSGANVFVAISRTNNTGLQSIYNISGGYAAPVRTSQNLNYNIFKYSPDGALLMWGGGSSINANSRVLDLEVDSGSNVYITGFYSSTTGWPVYNITNPPTLALPLMPNSITPSNSSGSWWPYILKYSKDGTFLGYSIIRCQNGDISTIWPTGGMNNSLKADTGGNIYWSGQMSSNTFCNVNSISISEPVTNVYSLNRTVSATTNPTSVTQSNAFVIQFGPSGGVARFTEFGSAQTTGAAYACSVSLSSTGEIYVSGAVASSSGGLLPNFGLQNPGGASPSYLPKSAISAVNSRANNILLYYDSSGVLQGVAQHGVTLVSPGSIKIDKNNYIYQCIYSAANQDIILYNIGNTTSGLSVPKNGRAQNTIIVKFNSSGNVVGYTRSPSTTTDGSGLYSDSNYIYFTCPYTKTAVQFSNVSSIANPPVLYAELPTVTAASPYMVKWAL
jgi:hypothetical protein